MVFTFGWNLKNKWEPKSFEILWNGICQLIPSPARTPAVTYRMEFRTESMCTKPAAFTFAGWRMADNNWFIRYELMRLVNWLHHDSSTFSESIVAVYNPVSIHKLLKWPFGEEAPRLDGYCQREGILCITIFIHRFRRKPECIGQQTHRTIKNFAPSIENIERIDHHIRDGLGIPAKVGQVVANCHKILSISSISFWSHKNRCWVVWACRKPVPRIQSIHSGHGNSKPCAASKRHSN